MFRLIKLLLILIGLSAVLWVGANRYAQYRVQTAFAEAGMSDDAAACVGRRLVERLSLVQLFKLAEFEKDTRTVRGLVRGVQQMDDREIVAVTTSSAALCSTGLAR
ncbi:hypothetical protein [Novosphingobium malaysiense]|uniref:Uncharacterized protein n=1 Tax=Novosphingobium malaysiense TaxID=1348853 RepID=A0A0B1ZKQ1_9SPHN|nr:hypothetical protein [Novosphingobium malaysiense]KHK91665.1 hypothetical protein LK12_12815 [Novosphingobium malaysiense]